MIGFEDWLRYVLGLLAVLGLIILLARGFRMLSERGLPGGRHRFRRLGVEEFLPLDNRRRLVLLRHDEQEYLVLLGHQGETLLNVAPRAASPPAAPGLLPGSPAPDGRPGPERSTMSVPPTSLMPLLRRLAGRNRDGAGAGAPPPKPPAPRSGRP